MTLCQRCWTRFEGPYNQILCPRCRAQRTLEQYVDAPETETTGNKQTRNTRIMRGT